MIQDRAARIKRARGAAAGLAGDLSRGGARQGLPEFGVSRVPGLGSGCDLAEEHEREMGDPPGHLKRGFRAWTGLATARGGTARRRIAGERCAGT